MVMLFPLGPPCRAVRSRTWVPQLRLREHVGIARAVVGAVDLVGHIGQDRVERVAGDDGVNVVSAVDGQRYGVAGVNRAGKRDVSSGENRLAGGIHDAIDQNIRCGGREYQHPVIQRIGDIQIGPVPGQRHWSGRHIRRRSGQIHATEAGVGTGHNVGKLIRFAQDDVGASGIPGGNRVEHQHTVIPRIGDKQARPVREREAREA